MTPTGEEVFCAHVLAGALEQYVGGTTKREFSPCGVCLDRGTPVLYSYPERYFTDLQAANIPIVEALILPLIADNHALGTIWIVSHDEQRHFDCEDVRVMSSLADFTATALLLEGRQTHQLLAANSRLEAEVIERQQAEIVLRESEEKYRTLFTSIDEGFCTIEVLFDEQGKAVDYRFLEMNQAFVQHTGIENGIGRTVREFAPEHEEFWFETYGYIAKTGVAMRFEHKAAALGKFYDVYAFRIGAPEKNRVAVIFNDIFVRKRAEEALRESEERFRLFVTAASDIIYRMSADWSEMHALEGKSFLADTRNPSLKWLEEYIPDSDKALVQAAIAEAVRAKTKFELEHRVIRADGTVGWTFSRAIPFLDERGEILEWFGAASDITDRKRAQEALRVFFSNVSHEFRTSLTLLLSSIQETLSDLADPLTPAQRLQLQLAHRNAVRLLKLVNTLLDVSRIEADRIQAVYEPTDLATLTTELASSFESVIQQAGLQLAIDCPPLLEPVYVDCSMWEKIVLNLLSNAFKFTITGEIAVRLRLAGNWVELTVQDTGIGIKAAELPHLFDRFYQGKQAKGRSFEGSGIGLSLVQELVKLHGGTITVSSVEGEGSCFVVSIPTGFAHLPLQQIGSFRTGGFTKDASRQSEDGLQNPPLPSTATDLSAYVQEALGWLPQEDTGRWGRGNAENQEDAGNIFDRFSVSPSLPSGTLREAAFQASMQSLQRGEPPQRAAHRVFASSSTPRILLVDDNADMRAYLKRLLNQRWQVETAADGAIALSQIQQQPPDLVLTDVMMPQMDGLQLLQALRSDPQTKSIPIILLSARATEEATVEGLATGADDYLIKPFSARELIARVETHLQLARLRQEQSANRFKTEFLMTVTHELQAPLVTILGWARLLQTKSIDSQTTTRALAAIERNATIEAKLVKDLLDVSSILCGKFQLNSQSVDLVLLVQNAIATFREAAQAKNIQLVETVSNVAQSYVLADRDRLIKIITNLLDNAIKFTPAGGQVNVRLERFESEVHMTVTDTGIGISPEFLPLVFDRFTQAEVPSRHSPGGVGIGLAIARQLVQLHGGTIEAASDGIGRGAKFTVKLPLMISVESP
ncbi:ATP-binding protein [Chlorogloeopsis sp. ULAP02]|uniref:ATP-binding protein n=1 Tax=Chlorogloeopsis sp. ULAP02 TaxID=3107926 RepID=UPI00398B8A1D